MLPEFAFSCSCDRASPVPLVLKVLSRGCLEKCCIFFESSIDDRHYALPISMETLTTPSKCQNIFVLNCTGTRGLHTIHASGSHQATDLLNPGKRESVPSARQSRHGRSHGSRGTILTTKLRLRWIKRSSLLWGIRHRSGFSKVLLLRTRLLAVAVGLQGSGGGGWRRVWWDGTVSISSASTSPLRSLTQQRGGKGQGILAVSLQIRNKRRGWVNREFRAARRERFEFFKSEFTCSGASQQLSVTEKALGLRPKSC